MFVKSYPSQSNRSIDSAADTQAALASLVALIDELEHVMPLSIRLALANRYPDWNRVSGTQRAERIINECIALMRYLRDLTTFSRQIRLIITNFAKRPLTWPRKKRNTKRNTKRKAA